MDALTTPLVHFYDTHQHRIMCGVRGFEERSTKHPRGVTCNACLALVGERPPIPAPSSYAGEGAAT